MAVAIAQISAIYARNHFLAVTNELPSLPFLMEFHSDLYRLPDFLNYFAIDGFHECPDLPLGVVFAVVVVVVCGGLDNLQAPSELLSGLALADKLGETATDAVELKGITEMDFVLSRVARGQ